MRTVPKVFVDNAPDSMIDSKRVPVPEVLYGCGLCGGLRLGSESRKIQIYDVRLI